MSRRQYAEEDPRTLMRVLSSPIDIVYYAQPGVRYPEATLVVDYDLSHLQQAAPPSCRCAELKDIRDQCRSIVINLPKFVPLAQTELDIRAASMILLPSGCLRIILPRKSGESRVCRMLSGAFAQVKRAVRRPCLFECHGPLQRSADMTVSTFEYRDPATGAALEFCTRTGLFSRNQIDPGTRLLSETVVIARGERVLDVGCGYGALGVIASVRGAKVRMVDSDCRAVALAATNLRRNGLAGETSLLATLDGTRSKAFTVVLGNPPTHGGSTVLQSLFREMARVCKPTGHVAIVVRERLNYEKWLTRLGDVSVAAVRDGYKVLKLVPSCGDGSQGGWSRNSE